MDIAKLQKKHTALHLLAKIKRYEYYTDVNHYVESAYEEKKHAEKLSRINQTIRETDAYIANRIAFYSDDSHSRYSSYLGKMSELETIKQEQLQEISKQLLEKASVELKSFKKVTAKAEETHAFLKARIEYQQSQK